MEVYIREYIRACEAFGWEGGPAFKTDIVPMANKREKRAARWSQSRLFVSIPYQNIRESTYRNILDMFEDRMGRWGAFLYRNPIHDVATDEVFAIAESGQTEFQIGIYVGQPGRQRLREVHALYSTATGSDGEAEPADIEITVNGAPASNYAIDHDRGVVVFDTPPGSGAELAWSGEYSHWVRFDQDELPLSIDNKSGDEFVLNGSVDLIGVPPPPRTTNS